MMGAEGIARALLGDDAVMTLNDVVPLLERIAIALEAQMRPTACGEEHASGKKCVLDQLHVGIHATADGRLHWLDDE